MKTKFPVLALALLLGGCLPESRFWWSPNGQEALVVSENALYLVQSDGPLGKPLIGGPSEKNVIPQAAAWLPDGAGFAAIVQRKIASWPEAAALVPPEESAPVELLAESMPALLKNAAALAVPPADASQLLASLFPEDSDIPLLALFRAYQSNPESIAAALAPLPKGEDLLKQLRSGKPLFAVYELCVVRLEKDRSAAPPQSLARSLQPMTNPLVSPDGAAVAWLQSRAGKKEPSLLVRQWKYAETLVVAEAVKPAFDWSSDGRSLVFAASAGADRDTLSRVLRAEVIQAQGRLMKPATDSRSPGEMPAPKELALALLPDPPRLQVLPGNRILFASQPARLPAAGAGPRISPNFFIASADGSAIEAVPAAPGTLPSQLSFFVASPDGALAAVIESGSDAVAVVNLSTGKVDVVSPAHPRWQCRSLPAWKSNNELSFAALDSPGGSPQWMLWSPAKGLRSLSKTWPRQATAHWLEKDKGDSR